MLPYERQIAIKAEQVDDALRRIGRLDGFELEPIVPAVEQWRYRNKLEYSFGTDDDGELVCGFHAPGLVGAHRARRGLPAGLRAPATRRGARRCAWCRERGLGAYDRRAQTGLLRNLVVREGRRTGELQVRLVTSDEAVDLDGFAEAVGAGSVLWTRALGVGETTAGGMTEVLHGTEAIEEELARAALPRQRRRLLPDEHRDGRAPLRDRRPSTPALQGWERVYDLFCGIGTIGLSLAPRAGEVWGLEIVEEAIADAIANARRNEIDNARFFAGDVRLALRELVETRRAPRRPRRRPAARGPLAAKVVRRIIEAAPTRIVYVSCNPTTLAPNAAQLVEAGYALRRVRPVDMFPQTPHIECVALLERA